MQTHFVTLEVSLGADLGVDLQASPKQLQQLILAELARRGEPLRWAIVAIDRDRQTAQIEAVVTTQTFAS